MQFGDWILGEAGERGWSLNELARRADVSSGGLSMVVNGLRRAGPELCRGIARAFGVSPVGVFQGAGILPPDPDMTPTMREAIHLFAQLPVAVQDIMLTQMRALVQVRGREYPVPISGEGWATTTSGVIHDRQE